jgi:hypothetical protein
MVSNFYAASGNFAAKTVSVAADRYKLLTPADGAIKIAGVTYYWPTQQTLDLSLTATWDTIAGTDYRTAANRAGKDFYVYAVPSTSGTTPTFLASANSSAPSGYTTVDSVLVDGFHCLCVAIDHNTTLTAWAADTVIAVGETRKSTVWNGKIIRCTVKAGDFKTDPATEPDVAGAAVGATLVDDQITWIVEQHSLEGYVAGDILPASVWDLRNRPTSLSIGMTYEQAAGVWCDIYEQSGTMATTTSTFGATSVIQRSVQNRIIDFQMVKKRLLRMNEYMMVGLGSNRKSGLAAIATTTGGHVDTYGRRMVSNIGCEDLNGNHMFAIADFVSTTQCMLVSGTGGATEAYWLDLIPASAEVWANTAANVAGRGCASSRIND